MSSINLSHRMGLSSWVPRNFVVMFIVTITYAGYTLLDKKHNEIRTELKTYNVKDKINQIRTNWLQHVERMSQNRLPQILLQYQPKGRRNVGHPITRWRY